MPDERIQGDDPQPERPRRTRPDDLVDDEFDRPRRRRRVEDDEEQGDVTGGLIPYKNGMALASYYCGVFGLIPMLGLLLGPIACILGILGFRYAGKNPKARGMAHSIVGIILGGVTIAYHLAFAVLIIAGMN